MAIRLRILRAKPAVVVLMLLMAWLGYTLAPPDLVPGEYQAEIRAEIDGEMHYLVHQFLVVEANRALAEDALDVIETRQGVGDYQLIVRGPGVVPYELGAQIRYEVQLVDADGMAAPTALIQPTSVITGPGYRQALPATDDDGSSHGFRIRVPYGAKVMTGLLFALPVLWLSEIVPLSAAAMLIPIVTVFSGVADAETVLTPFAHPIIALFLAGFLLAEGMRRTGVDRRIALLILNRASLRPAFLMLTMMALTAFLSMWMSNTASVAILIPIALTILERIPKGGVPAGYSRALVLAIAYSATLGGTGSAIGTPANMLALTFLNEYVGEGFGFVSWFAYGLPMVLIMLPMIWLYLMATFRVNPWRLGPLAGRSVYQEELRALGPIQREQRLILIVFSGVMLLWLTESLHNIPTAIVALTGAFVLFFAGLIKQEDVLRINWNALLTFGGGLAIGTLLVSAGVSDWVALSLTGLRALPVQLVLLLVAFLTLGASAFMSNTACAAIMIPLSIPLSQVLGIDPRLMVPVVAIASSLDFALVVGTPPTMMAYSTGIFKVSDIFRRGIALDIVGGIVLSQVVVYIWWLLGVVDF